MSTPTALPSFEEIKGHLNQIGHHLFRIDTPLVSEQKQTTHQVYLDSLNDLLKNHRKRILGQSRALYEGLKNSDLHSEDGKKQLASLKNTLNPQLLDMDLRELIGGKSGRSFMIYDAGFTAISHEAQQAVQAGLLHRQAGALIEKLALGPTLRPGLYALRFSYQEQNIELAGACVVTEKNSPEVGDLSSTENVGAVMLFTQARGIEAFSSLAQLDDHLLQTLNQRNGHEDFMQMLPARYHTLSAAGIWPLQLSPIDSKPLFEHLYDALIDKRTQDIDRALSLVDNPAQDRAQLLGALDRAIDAALPTLTPRLQLHAQTLFERSLRASAPDWYRSASSARQAELAQHLGRYNQARQHFLDLMGAAATPQTLARHQWLERLSDDLEIDDLEPQHLQISTRRQVAGFGGYEHRRNLIDLALRGPHTGDELPGSDFLQNTTLTYLDAPLHPSHTELTPAWLVQQAITLQPRVDFSHEQKQMHARPAVRQAIEHMLDQRIAALAYTALMQGHLLDDDWQMIQRLRADSDPQLSAATLSLHDAQFRDLWVLRQTDATGTLKRVLLCTPEAPRSQQFQAFDSEIDCQAHMLGWAKDGDDSPGSMTDYLINRAPLRFRNSLRQVLSSLSFKPQALEYKEVTFTHTGNHRQCLNTMVEHVLATRIDDYDFGTPLWYRSATAQQRRQLSTLSEDAEGTLHEFNEHTSSGSRFPGFDAFLHEQAKQSLNQLLKRKANDVDPDTVWAYSPPAIVGGWTPPPLTYTQLYRDGYADGIGLLDEKFSRSARFKGPQGVDLSALTPEKVARSVTGVWIGQRYTAKVREKLQSADSPGYDFRRNATLAITRRQMQGAALECHLRGHIVSLDLQWLEQCLAQLGDTSAQTRNDYVIHRLMIDGEWVIDTWLFSHGTNPVLLYTPEAPDGISFREARLFNHLLKKQPGMIEYFTNRVAIPSRGRVRLLLEAVKKQLPDSINTTTSSMARYDSTRSVTPVSDMRYALYNMKLQRKIDDVHATTVSEAQMISNLIWSCVEWVAAIATAPLPILSLSTGLLLAFKDAMLALHAYNQGDNSAALEHLVGYLFNSAGGLLTDLRPALHPLKPVSRSLRLPMAGTEQNRAMNLISQLEPAPPSPTDMRPVVFQGRTLWAPNTPDPIGRYLLHSHDPITGKWHSTGRLVTKTNDGGWVRSGVSGGAPKYEPVPQTEGPHLDYGIAPRYRERLELVMDPLWKQALAERDVFLGAEHFVIDHIAMDLLPVREAYLQQVNRLTGDAKAFFDEMIPLEPRAPAPAVHPDTSFAQLIASDAFAANKHLVIGARADSFASKLTLIAHMDTLSEKGFKRLYLEYLPGDVFHAKLEKLNSGKSWRHIEKHLKALDRALGYDAKAAFSYLALVRAAREKGMKIKALDASTSYLLDDVLLMADVSPTTPRGNDVRNFYSHKVIAADTADAPDERWIVLTSPSRMLTFDKTPGLADLHPAVAVRIDDVALDQPARIGLDSPGAIDGDASAKGDYRVTVPTAHKVTEPLAQPVATPGPSAQHFNKFDIAPSLQDEIVNLGSEPHGLDSRYAPTGKNRHGAYSAFIDTRSRLNTEATGFFASYTPPAKATLPTITANTTPQSFLKQVADSNLPGLIVGEAHAAQSSKALLKTQMKNLKAAGYKTLYMEHLLTDLHQAELDIFHRTQRMPDRLKAYLRAQDRGQMSPFYRGDDTYTAVVQAASKYGIRVRALDCTASYHIKGLSDADTTRNMLFSYFACQVIQADQLAQGPHKWIAFIGSAHTNYQLGVPGLADMLGTVSLHVRDTTPELARGIHLGSWETVSTGLRSTVKAIRSDFKLEVAIADMWFPAPVAPVDRARLIRPGQYLIERPTTLETLLVHRSGTGDIIATPIEVDNQGLFFIDRWGKKDKRFKYMNTLTQMLESEVNLQPVS